MLRIIDMRISKIDYYLDIAMVVSSRSTCLRRKYGAVIVKNDQLISTGFNGSPRGAVNCCDIGMCRKNIHNIPHGVGYTEFCESTHAEQNAIIHASRQEMLESTLYIAGTDYETGEELLSPEPCSICMRMIINAGIDQIITRKLSIFSSESNHFSDMYNVIKLTDVVHGMKNSRAEKD